MNVRLILFFLLLLLIIPSNRARGNTPPAIAALTQKLEAACRSHDLQAIKACYCTTGATPEQIDLELSPWQEYLNQSTDITHWTYDRITYRSLVELRDDKTMNHNFIASLGRHRMGEHFYEENLQTVGFITCNFTAGKGSSVGNTLPVGIASDGQAWLSTTNRVN